MRSQVEAIGNGTTYPHFCSSWMKDSELHQRIKPERDYDTPTTITKVESTLDKRKDTRAVNNEKLEDITMLRRTPSNSNNI